jgi:hypothetical protein
MILKCKNAGDSDQLFDGFDQITYTYKKKDDVIGVREDHLDFLEMKEITIEANCPENNISKKRVSKDFVEIWLYKNCNVIKQILAHSPIYVMNDEGKTIEKI